MVAKRTDDTVAVAAEYLEALERLLDVCRASQRIGLKDDYPPIGTAVRMALAAKEKWT